MACRNWTRLLGLLGLAIISGSDFVRADQPHPAELQSNQAKELPLGVPCRVESYSLGERVIRLGRLSKLTSECIVLQPASSPDLARKIPDLKKPMKQLSLSAEPREIWIPRNAIYSITFDQQGAAVPQRAGTDSNVARRNLVQDTVSDVKSVSKLPTRDLLEPLPEISDKPISAFSRSQADPQILILTAGEQEQERLKPEPEWRVILRPVVIDDLWTQSRHQRSYVGKPLKSADGRLLLKATKLEGRCSGRVWILSDVPLLARYLKNTGVGSELLDNQEIWLEYKAIASIEIAD